MPTRFRHVARKALEEGRCMGNPEIGAPGCHRAPAEGMHHGRCQLCQDIWNLWRRENRQALYLRTRRRRAAREDSLFALVGRLRGKRQQLAFWVLRRLGYELDERSFLTMDSPPPPRTDPRDAQGLCAPYHGPAPTLERYASLVQTIVYINAAAMDEAGKL